MPLECLMSRNRFLTLLTLTSLGAGGLTACERQQEVASPPTPPVEQAAPKPRAPKSLTPDQLAHFFRPLPPAKDAKPAPKDTEAQVSLGRMLFFEPRLSKNHDVSCNTCHGLDTYGVDNKALSDGHRGQKGTRNSPTVYNAAGHVAQFWDGRAATIEDQAKGPILNPIEMGMPDPAFVLKVLKSIPGYEPLFKAAFPADKDPINYDNLARA